MALRLADRLTAARRRQFVGRRAELALFQSLLEADDLPFCVLFIFGPGGVGKTTLLQEFTALCQQAEQPAILIDGRNTEPTPEAFLQTLQWSLGVDELDDPLMYLARQAERHVLLIDTFESLAPLDNWLRDQFLPQLPDNVVVVIAGRHPPGPAWRSDSGWQSLIRAMPLRNLSEEETRTYLKHRNLPAREHQAVLDFTQGYPLALSLVADVFAQRGDVQFQPEVVPDVVQALLKRLVQKAPGPAHRSALEACALVRLTTESVLSAMLGGMDAHELFEWLRELSFIESGPYGIFPHDLAREALVADVRWRNPDWYALLHKRARDYYLTALRHCQGPEQRRVLFDLVYLHRTNPVLRPYFEWRESALSVGQLGSADVPDLVAMVRRYEGDEAAEYAQRWYDRYPQHALVFYDAHGMVAGQMLLLRLSEVDPALRDADPATRTAWRYLQRHAPLRPGELATLSRFWMARDTYQNVSAVQSLCGVLATQHYLTTPGLAYSFTACGNVEFWTPAFSYADIAPLPEAEFDIGGRRFGMFGHDWRVTPPLAWLDLLGQRELATRIEATPTPMVATPVLVLSQDAFESAVRDALHDLARSDVLRANPLVRSRLILERAGREASENERAAALQAAITEATEALKASPRDLKSYRALYHTYLHPGRTQEQVAEMLDLPFSTFRRHLKAGITRVSEHLWQSELQGSIS